MLWCRDERVEERNVTEGKELIAFLNSIGFSFRLSSLLGRCK